MQPTLETFREAVNSCRGNLSRVATVFKCTRATIANWVTAGGEEWKQVVRDARMRLFDDCLVSAEVLARGIPDKDENGNILGWLEKPDGQMVRYLLSTLGKQEGFGDTPETAADKPLEASQPKAIRVQVVYNSAEDLKLQENEQTAAAEKEETE